MKLFVGLGNPGAKYARNRHNIGYLAADAIADAHGFPPWRSKFGGVVAEGRLATEKVLLLKPGTYMNLSGDAVRAASQFYKVDAGDIVVFHDELDLAPGRVRVKTGGGHAGHNGLRSIAAHLGPDFVRVRLGIGHPGDKRLVTNYVLGDFARADDAWLTPLLGAIADAAPDLAEGDNGAFLRRVGQAAGAEARPEAHAAPAAAAPPPEESRQERGPLQRLIDRFR
jgi:peptidyl-tRNA hydrolase, PTH1 family